MNRDEINEARSSFKEFLQPILPLLGRLERRHWAEFYVQGLLLDGRRKTTAGMARAYAGNQQSIQQFVTDSPWEWMPVRGELGRRMVQLTGKKHGAWILDGSCIPKKGHESVGVASQYCGTVGNVHNSQHAVSLSYAVDGVAFPLDFELYMPQPWVVDWRRRAKTRIPADVVFKRHWEMGLEMIDTATSWGIARGVVVTDSEYGDVSEFRLGLTKRGLEYAVGVSKKTAVWTEPVDVSRPIHIKQLPMSQQVLEVARALPADAWQEVTWREGSKGPLKSRFARVRVQPSHGVQQYTEPEGMQWLLIEWIKGQQEPEKYYLSNLPEDVTLEELVYWARSRWPIEQNYQQLKDELGLDHFEGRTWPGWHHHVTMTMIAYDFLVAQKLQGKKSWLDSSAGQARTAAYTSRVAGILPSLRKTSAYR